MSVFLSHQHVCHVLNHIVDPYESVQELPASLCSRIFSHIILRGRLSYQNSSQSIIVRLWSCISVNLCLFLTVSINKGISPVQLSWVVTNQSYFLNDTMAYQPTTSTYPIKAYLNRIEMQSKQVIVHCT